MPIFLAVQRMRNDKTLVWQRSQTGPALLGSLSAFALFIILFLVMLNAKAYYGASFMMIGLIGAMVWYFGGTVALKKLAFPIAYLLLMVPLPFIERYTLPLALFTGVCSGGLVTLLGMNITIIGNAVTLPNVDLIIGAQCSGMNSLIALTAITALAAYIVSGPLWAKLALVLCAIPLALMSNILRVSSLLYVASEFGAEAGFTFYHDYSGPVFFAVALFLLYPLAKLLRFRDLRLDVI